ncbi:glycosyltransferase family 2 protein [Rhizosphaericola mali]|uniref:Glycosyltransferase family 2 protein n=1 Tax=Rhizosphaericola mali TaxID=2545455 RepID=A0A5P2G3K0_9BACT|nr:glycosyltransferase family 2 protein [Rhizosphaericola mali]QES89308.1 glycosyltransferase family 2 protein [Rhizosphaericola mali]
MNNEFSQGEVDVSIITVGMNHLKYLKSLFHSLFFENRPLLRFEVIYIDNCSMDGSVDYISSNYPEVKIFPNEQSYGFGKNNNIGVEKANGKYIAIINPDIVLLQGSIDRLFNYSETFSEATLIVPQLLNPDLTFQNSVRRFMTLKTFLYRLVTRANDEVSNALNNYYLCKDIDFSKIQYIDWALGAAFFLPRSLYNKLNGFDTDYIMYVEDTDFCLRAWKNGHKVIYNPSSKMIHNHLRGSSKIGKKTLLHLKSYMLFFEKHGLFIKKYSKLKIN